VVRRRRIERSRLATRRRVERKLTRGMAETENQCELVSSSTTDILTCPFPQNFIFD